MTTPNGEPQNPYTSAQPTQGQNQQYAQYPQQTQYQNGYPGYSAQSQLEGNQLAQTSMILGILSLFVLGIVLGPIAIVKARRAEREFNTAATVGKVTGWIGTILAAITILCFIGFILLAIFVPDAAYESYDTYDF
ncbi:DUF4190 domain-containing protein [Glutamicibacter ectropisis]|uniref:DUF4190 domain-containing protein n=1 Tax=Glutamicibacter ectropisis TaxID=3046593 RepID=A0AAU6WBS1_9MICC